MSAKPMYYGRIAYEGFAKAYGARHGVTVTVKPGANPSVNAQGEITLPSMDKYQTAEEFESTCASVIHEVSHVLYGSHVEFANAHTNGKDTLYMDCLNAVLDVCDETAIGAKEESNGNRRPEHLLVSANDSAYVASNGFVNHPKHARILCNGIVRARMGRHYRYYGNSTVTDIPEVDVNACYRILRAARTPKGTPKRTTNAKLAERLAKILAPVAPPPNDKPAIMPVSGASNAQGEDSLPADGIEAGEMDGEQIAGGKRAGSYYYESPEVSYNRAHEVLLPAIKRVAQRMATDGDSIMRDEGYTSGAGVSQAFRLFTDGNCMGRWFTNEHADGMSVAVLLDTSGSMDERRADCAGLADAFAEGMREYATVKTWAFDSRVMPVHSFKTADGGGGTRTAQAIDAANVWLKTREGKKVTVIITDGQPDSISDCQTTSMQSPGKVIGIALDTRGEYLRQSMPNALVIEAVDAARLAMELDYIGHQLAGQS